jgi:hypothetical protein
MNLPPALAVQAKADDEPGLVQGQMPDSINEWYVSLALDRLKLDYQFQVPIMGGRGVRGGQVIDFVVWTATGGIPVFVQGAYWHDIRHDPDAVIKQAAAEHHYHNKPVLLDEDKTDTREKAYRTVLQEIGP